MASNDIKLKLSIDGTKETVKDLEKMNSELDSTKKKLDKPVGDKSFDELNGGLKESISNIELFGVSLGDVGKGFTKLGKNIKLATASTKAFRVALISTGIGAVAVALGSLAAAFLSTQEGADAVSKAIRPLKVIFETFVGFLQDTALEIFREPETIFRSLGDFIVGQLTTRIQSFVNIIKGLGVVFTALKNRDIEGIKEGLGDMGDSFLDMATGVEDVRKKTKDSIDGIKDSIDQATESANTLSQLDIDIDELEIRNARLIPALERELELQRLIAEDSTKTAAERESATQKAIDTLSQMEQAQLDVLDKEIERMELAQTFNDTSREERLELANLQAERDSLAARRLSQEKELQNRLNSIRKEGNEEDEDNEEETVENKALIRAKELEDVKRLELLKLQNADSTTDEILQAEIELATARYKVALENEELTNTQKEILRQEHLAKINDLENQHAENLKNQADKIRQENFKAIADTIEEMGIMLGSFQLSSNEVFNAVGQGMQNVMSDFSSAVETFGDAGASMADKIVAGLNVVMSVVDMVGNTMQAKSQQELDRIETNRDAQIQAEEDKFEAGVITEQQLETAKRGINNKFDEEKEKAEKKKWEQEKKIRMTQAVMGTITGVISALASGFAIPVVGVVMGPLFAGIAAAMGAAQIAMIKREKYPGGGGSGGGGGSTPPAPKVPPMPDVSGVSQAGDDDDGELVSFSPNNFDDPVGDFSETDNRRSSDNQNQGGGSYVSETDITSTQNRVRVIEDDASFG